MLRCRNRWLQFDSYYNPSAAVKQSGFMDDYQRLTKAATSGIPAMNGGRRGGASVMHMV
jgi:hypothetical protein